MRKKVSESFKEKMRMLHFMSMAFVFIAIIAVFYTIAVGSEAQFKYVFMVCIVIAGFFFICDIIHNYVIKFLEEGISKKLVFDIIREIVVLLVAIHFAF